MIARQVSFVAVVISGLLIGHSTVIAAQDSSELAVKAQAILKQHCFECHGGDPEEISGDGLKILDHDMLIGERKIVVSKAPDASELIVRIEEQDEDNRMPPTPKDALSAEDQQTLRDWIASGAASFPSPKQPEESPPPLYDKTAEHVENSQVLAAQVKEILRRHCWECHGGAKTNAGIKILDHQVLVSKKKKVKPGQPDESQLLKVILAEDQSVMPPAGQPRLMAADIDTIRRWIAHGAAPFPTDVSPPDQESTATARKDVVGVDYVLEKILDHRRTLRSNERPFVRYFSTNHLLTGGATRDELDIHQDALTKAINHLSTERMIVHPEPIDAPLNTVFAVDIRQLGWQKQPFERVVDDRSSGKSSLNLFDLALLEYPYGIVYEDSALYDRLVEEFIIPARLARPIPFVRADWFISLVTQPPLYEDFLGLPMNLEDLERQLGVDSEENVKNGIAKRAGMTVSGVSRNNRVVERHPTALGFYWKSYDFASSKGRQSMFHDPVDMSAAAGGEMIFSLPNGLQGYFVTTGQGKRLDRAPTDIVTDKFAENKTVVNGLSCIRCHDQGMKTFADNVRPAIERLPGSPGFDKRHALQLYAPQAEMEKLVEQDEARFTTALAEALGKPQLREPLVPVTQRFLDAPLHLSAASAELGLASPEGLAHLFRAPQFVGLGLVPLSSQGAVRRDTWEDYYDQIVRQLGLGIPVVPLDGLARLDYPPNSPSVEVELSTNKKNNVFAPGDELVIFVSNHGAKEIHIELIGTSAEGEKVILAPASTVLRPGGQFRFPAEGGLKIQPGLGQELITLLACDSEFPAGEVLRGEGVIDRVFHPFYQLTEGEPKQRLTFDPAKLVKKTIAIETQ